MNNEGRPMNPVPTHARLRRVIAAAVAASGLSSTAAFADLVEIKWDSAGGYEKTLTIAPAKFAEVCGKLKKGQAIAWSFSGQQPLNFNIHYHEGKKVVFPLKQDNTASLDGTLAVTVDQDYCWMWENKGGAPASLVLKLRRA
jgi:hypothetical protein